MEALQPAPTTLQIGCLEITSSPGITASTLSVWNKSHYSVNVIANKTRNDISMSPGIWLMNAIIFVSTVVMIGCASIAAMAHELRSALDNRTDVDDGQRNWWNNNTDNRTDSHNDSDSDGDDDAGSELSLIHI